MKGKAEEITSLSRLRLPNNDNYIVWGARQNRHRWAFLQHTVTRLPSVTFSFNPNCYLIVHRGLQVQLFPNDLHPRFNKKIKRKAIAVTKLEQSIYHFLSGKKIFFLSPSLSDIKCLTFWVKLDVFIVLTESFIESYVNKTCKHTVFFLKKIWCSVIFLKLAAVIYCFPLFLFCPVSLTVCAESCRSMCLCLLKDTNLWQSFFFSFSCLELCEIMEKLHRIICCRWSLS